MHREVEQPRLAARGKDTAIESLRGLAAILMVAGHVIGGGDSSRGMQVGPDSGWTLFYQCLEDVRMPLFTMLSGFVFALRPPMARSAYPQLIRSKFRRLVVPMAVVGTILFFSQLLIPFANARPSLSSFPLIFIYSFQHLWFLQAVFLIFAVVGLAEIFGLLATRRRFLAVFAVSAALHMFVIIPSPFNVFSVNSALQLLSFFLVGYGLRRYSLMESAGPWLVIPSALFVGAYTFRLMQITGEITVTSRLEVRAASFAVGLTAVILLYSARSLIRNRVLTWIGGFAFGIYLLHIFATSAFRVALTKLGLDASPLIFTVSLTAGVLFPIVFQLLLGRFNPVRVLILGERALPVSRRARSRTSVAA